MSLLLVWWACATPDPRTSVVVSTVEPTPPSTTPTTPQTTPTTPPPATALLPVGLALAVEPLVIGAPAPLRVEGAAPGAEITVWRGGFGGTSCPPELAGGCVPVAGVSALVSGTADAAGVLRVDWLVPATHPEGDYPVLVATADGARSLPVMRRTWAGAPDFADRSVLDPFDVVSWTVDEPVPVFPPGDWMDLALDGRGDRWAFEALGNETVDARAAFHAGLSDVLPGLVSWPGSEAALVDWSFRAAATRDDMVFEGQSLATGTWGVGLEADYAEHQGLYDLIVRITAPTEPRAWYPDADGDDWGDEAGRIEAPVAPDGAVFRAQDCDDLDADVNPEAWDVCDDGADDDCSGADKRCHGAPDADGTLGSWSALRVTATDGYDVAAVGDADGDGVVETWIRENGHTWVVQSPPGPQLAPPWITNTHGWGATRAGDFDRDGRPDLAYGGKSVVPEGGVWFVSLPTDPASIGVAPWATLVGPAVGSGAGEWLDTGGDVDGDGVADLLVQGDEAAWLLTAVPPGVTALDAAAVATFTGAAGAGFATGADLDGDGLDDVVARGRDQVHVLFAPFAGGLDVPSAAGATLTPGGTLSSTVNEPLGDTDGDGVAELLLATTAGAVSIFESPSGALDASAATVAVTVPRLSRAALADLDADGFDDLIVTRAGDDWDGLVEILYGPLPATAEVPADADVRLVPAEGETTGYALFAGDFDLDGLDDVAIGTYDQGAGETFLDFLFGGP